jgi:hypothetical protein
MSEDNAYTKLAQIVLGTFIEQVADLVRARINTSVSVNEEMIQGMVCEAFKHEFDAAMKDTFNRRIDSAIEGIDLEDMIEQAINTNITSSYIKRVVADIIEEKMPDKSTSEIGMMSSQLGNLEGQMAGLRRDMNKIVQTCMSIGVSNL